MPSSNRRISKVCIKAIEDIQSKTQRGLKVKEVPFTMASEILGIKYFEKNFRTLSFDEIRRLYKEKYL